MYEAMTQVLKIVVSVLDNTQDSYEWRRRSLIGGALELVAEITIIWLDDTYPDVMSQGLVNGIGMDIYIKALEPLLLEILAEEHQTLHGLVDPLLTVDLAKVSTKVLKGIADRYAVEAYPLERLEPAMERVLDELQERYHDAGFTVRIDSQVSP